MLCLVLETFQKSLDSPSQSLADSSLKFLLLEKWLKPTSLPETDGRTDC